MHHKTMEHNMGQSQFQMAPCKTAQRRTGHSTKENYFNVRLEGILRGRLLQPPVLRQDQVSLDIPRLVYL